VDFRKAFDLVGHNILFTKLSKYNISNFLQLLFASYLTNRQQRARVNSSVSTFKNLKGAMPQGSGLNPLAFLVLIDNTTLSELVHPKELDTHILTYLADLLTWAVHDGMEINTSKTKEMILGRLSNTNLPLPNIASQTVERVTTYKLLGAHVYLLRYL